jgi:hypothetical protein
MKDKSLSAAARQSRTTHIGKQSSCDPAWIRIKRGLLHEALIPLNADLDQNSDP